MHATAREFFESAREAARDAERIRRQLDAMESRALSLGGGGYEGRVRSTPDPGRIGASVSAMLDQTDRLREREAEESTPRASAPRMPVVILLVKNSSSTAISCGRYFSMMAVRSR